MDEAKLGRIQGIAVAGRHPLPSRNFTQIKYILHTFPVGLVVQRLRRLVGRGGCLGLGGAGALAPS